MSVPRIILEYDFGGFEVGGSWNWTVDNGRGLTAQGNCWTARRAVKQAQKTLAKIQGIESKVPIELKVTET